MRTRTILICTLSAIALFSVAAYAQQPPAPAATVKLADLLAEAEQKSPAIRATAQAVAAKRARVPQARALPDPQLTIGYMGDPAPFKTQANDPSSYRQFGVMQEIPYPGKRDLRGKIAEKDADAEQWNVEAARRRVRAQVKLAYYELWSVDKALEITMQNKDLLEKFARIAEVKYKVGKGLQQDVLRAQVEVSRMLQRLTILRQRRHTLEAQLNSLLVRPQETPIGTLEPAEKSVFAYSLDELLQKAVDNFPEIQKQQQVIEQSQLAVDLARKSYYPDFNVGLDYQNRGSSQRDMYGLRFTLNLPVFYKSKQRQAVNEAGLSLSAAQQVREAIRTSLLFQVKEQYLSAKASEELLNLYSKAIVPQSTLAVESGLASYQVGSLDFLSLITSFTNVLDYEVNYYDELANYQKALARLEEITGIQLTK
jgi:cobalt-zinc-cadmium efflux system outer membrane protein